MKKLKFLAFALAASALVFSTSCNGDDDPPRPQPDPLAGQLLVFQAWGSGPGGGAAANRSFVELYNTTNNAINLQGITLYWANGVRGAEVTADEPWNAIALTGTIPANGSFLVLGPIAGTGGALQIEEAYGDMFVEAMQLSNRSFKVALIRRTGELTYQNPFNIDGNGTKIAGYIDMVGSANSIDHATNPDNIFGFETVPTRNSGSEAVRRGSLVDTDNNYNDFVAARFPDMPAGELEARRPRNSAAGSWDPFAEAIEPPAVTNITRNPVAPTNLTDAIITATIAPGTGTVAMVTLHWRLQGATTTTEVNMMPLTEGVGSGTIPMQAIDAVVEYFIVAVNSVDGETTTETRSFTVLDATVPPHPLAGNLLILQANIQGNSNDGRRGSGFPRHTVELFNNTDGSVDLTGLYLHTGSNTAWQTAIALTGTIPANSSFLIVSTEGGNPTYRAELPTADQTAAFVFANNFRVAILATDEITVNNPFGEADYIPYYVDMLGVGSSTAFEAAPATNQSGPRVPRRTSLVDTDDNSADFSDVDYRAAQTDILTNAVLYRVWPRNSTMGAWNPITGLPRIDPVPRVAD